MKIKGAIFDMDGTLVDSLMFWDFLWKKLNDNYIKEENFKPAIELDRGVRTMIFADAVASIKEYYKLPVDTDALIEFSQSGLADFYRNVVKSKKGAIELLEYLKANDIKICLASATARDGIAVALESCKLEKYFDHVLSCYDIGVGKDRPDIYILAKETLGFEADEICVFEDSYVALETAKKAGFKTVGIFDKYNFCQDRLEAASDIYLREGEGLDRLIEYIEA